jgi:nucleoside-diphosphate-sugar epimerase
MRPSSSRSFLSQHDSKIEFRNGSIDDPASLRRAMSGMTHVVHCAGRTAACRREEFFQTNQVGTRNVVEAANATNGRVQRLLHISSLAVSGPGTPENPCRENFPPNPISHYGRSKLAAEKEVRERCATDWVIVRPPAVYGPRDNGFLTLFKAVASHLLPKTNARQALSLVYVEDLAEAVVATLLAGAASRKTYFAASSEIVTAREMSALIAREMGAWTVAVPLPSFALWPVCLGQELLARLSGKARLLNLQKFAELRAPGWVCDASLLAREVGCKCETKLETGVARTLRWYRENGWL